MDILDQFLDAQPVHSVTSSREWSTYQEAVFEACRSSNDNLLINAVAGSGKSTTLVAAMEHTQGSNLFLAFNRAISEEMKGKVGSQGVVKTLNSLGQGTFYRHRRGELDDRRVLGFLKVLLGEGSEDYKTYAYQLKRVVGLMKNCAMGLGGPVDLQDVVQLIDSYQLDIPFERLTEFSQKALAAFSMSVQPSETWDYDDQLYLPLLNNWEYPFFSNVFVDECQDLSPIQHLMLAKMAERGSRIIAVGDPHQAIYGFRGALSNSIGLLKERFQMRELPLSISYRCARAIIASAQQQCPHILARDSAPEGSVRWRSDEYEELPAGPEDEQQRWTEDPHLFDPGLLVISRNNAPLFRAILRHVRAKSPCRVLTNFLETFEGFIRGFKVSSTADLLPKLDQWYANEKEAALKKGFKGRVAALLDKYETAVMLAKEFKSIDDIIYTLKRLGAGTTGPIFSTVHKAKGLEAESVYILRPDTIPSPFAATPEARQQEENLLYVAKTRAKTTLTFGISPEF